MKFALFPFCAFIMFASVAFAEVNPDFALQQLEKSGTVFADQLTSTRAYAKSKDYVETNLGVSPQSPGNDRYLTLNLIFRPKNPPAGSRYPINIITVYFIAPSSFDEAMGRNELNFYRFNSVVDMVDTSGPRH